MSNVITATFESGETSIVTESQYQWATGQVLMISGIDDLPDAYRANISNSYQSQAKTQVGTAEDGVIIPDVYFTTGKNIYVWIMLSTGDDDTEVEYAITIPIIEASEPEDSTATEEQVTIVNQAINALADALSDFQDATDTVETAVTKMNSMAFSINDTGELIYTYEGSE